MIDIEGLISVAKGDVPAELLLTNARIVNTFTAELEMGNVAIWGERIAGVGDYHQGREVLDLGGRYLAPGLIDGHTHVESSMLHIAEYVPELRFLREDDNKLSTARNIDGCQQMQPLIGRLAPSTSLSGSRIPHLVN